MRNQRMKQLTRRRFLKLMVMSGATAAIDWHSIDVLAASIPDIQWWSSEPVWGV